jgi:FixJ family two-component response regulator
LHCFLFKPFQAQQLVDEVRKAIAEWRGERPLVGGR